MRFFVVGALVGVLTLAAPLAQSEYIRQIAGGLFFGPGNAQTTLGRTVFSVTYSVGEVLTVVVV